MIIHNEPHALAFKVVTISSGEFAGREYQVEDWWDRVAGKSWMSFDGNPACLDYAIRSAQAGKPLDDKVVYGKIEGLGKLVHISDLPQQST